MMPIDSPMALAVVEWISSPAGGRPNGPPSWPYATICEFLEENMTRHPGHKEFPEFAVSILIEPIELVSVTVWKVKVDYIAREAVLPCLWKGRQLVLREGHYIVAVAMITDVLVTKVRDPRRE